MKDPLPLLSAINKTVAMQLSFAGGGFCTGIVYITKEHPCLMEIFRSDFSLQKNDEEVINDRLTKRRDWGLLIEPLNRSLFPIGCEKPCPNTMMFHANFRVGITEKIARLKEVGAWHLRGPNCY
jgi:hypothetical protein